MPLQRSDIEALVELFTQSDWDELHLALDGEEILLSNNSRAQTGLSGTTAATPATQATSPTAVESQTDTPPAASRPASWVVVKAPNLGTFYTSPSPDAEPYVTVGDQVTPETEICLIEVMKLFTTVRAGVAGIVLEIAVEDGEMVEYNQALFWIEPD
jgi:acetyl-CoA carboxylase biotin carboxyl carrier protein